MPHDLWKGRPPTPHLFDSSHQAFHVCIVISYNAVSTVQIQVKQTNTCSRECQMRLWNGGLKRWFLFKRAAFKYFKFQIRTKWACWPAVKLRNLSNKPVSSRLDGNKSIFSSLWGSLSFYPNGCRQQHKTKDRLSHSSNHVTFESEAGRTMQTHYNVDASLFVTGVHLSRSIRMTLVAMFERQRSDLEKITHRRFPRSWHTPWPSKACSSSPSPERGRGERRVVEWIHTEDHFSIVITDTQ